MRKVDERELGLVAAEDSAAHRAIHSVQGSPAFGPQNVWNGKRPSDRSSYSHSPSGVPVIPKTLFPSAP